MAGFYGYPFERLPKLLKGPAKLFCMAVTACLVATLMAGANLFAIIAVMALAVTAVHVATSDPPTQEPSAVEIMQRPKSRQTTSASIENLVTERDVVDDRFQRQLVEKLDARQNSR